MVFLDLETAFRHSFLSRELECLPHGDPRNLCENIRIRLLATHSLACISQIRIIAAIIIGEFFFYGFFTILKGPFKSTESVMSASCNS